MSDIYLKLFMGSIHKYVLQNIYNIFLIKKLTASYINTSECYAIFQSCQLYSFVITISHNSRPFHIKSFLLKSGFWNEFIDLVETKQDIKQYMYDYPNSKISKKKFLYIFNLDIFVQFCVFFQFGRGCPHQICPYKGRIRGK